MDVRFAICDPQSPGVPGLLAIAPSTMVLGGVALAAAPVIIHIIFRFRYRLVEFAAMRFIFDSLKRNRQRLLLEEVIIIALRVLACLLVGLTLADCRGRAVTLGSRTPMAHVYVLDDSMSMGQRAGAATLFQKAVTQLADSIQKLDDNDMVAIISASQPESGKPLGSLALARDVKRDDFYRRLTSLKPTDLRAHFPEALAAVRKAIESQKDHLPKVYIISDFRRADFADAQTADALRKAFASVMGGHTELSLLDYGMPCRENLSVERLELLDKLAVAGVGTQFQVTVRNNGTETAEGVSVTPKFGSVTLPVIALPPIAPGEAAKKAFRYVLPSPGVAWASASVAGDALSADDQATLAFEVYDSLRMLIVDGSADPGSSSSASFCLAHAIDPTGQGSFGQKVDVIGPQALGDGDLDNYDLVVLTNVREFAPARDQAIYPQLQALERYVRGGGGLGIFVGDKINVDFYNGPLHLGGAGLSPLRLAEGPLPVIDNKQFARLRSDSIGGESMLRIFTGATEKFSRLVRFYGFVRAKEAGPNANAQGDAGPVQVLARLDDKDASPAVARRAFGKGTLIMWYTCPDTKWTDWPKDFSFLPVMNDMAWSLARSRAEGHHGQVLQPIVYALSGALSDATAVAIKTPAYPAEDVQMLQPRGESKHKKIEYMPTIHAGLYEVELTLADRSQRKMYFSRSIDPAESNLAKASEAEVAKAVGQPHTYRGNLAVAAAELAETSGSQTYWWVFLGALLVVLALESFLAQRFGHYSRR